MYKKILFILPLILIPIESAHALYFLDVWTDKDTYYLGEPITAYIHGTGFPTHVEFPTSCQVDYIMDGIYDSAPDFCLKVITYVNLPHMWTEQHILARYAPGLGSHSITAYMHEPWRFFCSSTTAFFNIIPRVDINQDGYVDFIDYSILAKAWKSTPSDGNWNYSCNLAPPDDIINERDLAVVCEYWLQ